MLNLIILILFPVLQSKKRLIKLEDQALKIKVQSYVNKLSEKL